MSTETAFHALKDATAAETQSANAQPVNQDSSWSDQDASLHAMPVSSETETTVAENAPTHAHHAHQPLLAQPVSKPKTNQSTESATTVFTHAHHAQLLNNVPHA